MTPSAVLESTRFHLRHAAFGVREQFSDLPSALAANAIIPFFVWVLSRLWLRFNSAQGNFSLPEVVLYLGITELLYMTFVRGPSVSRASSDFSISLSRPRSWLMTSLSGLVGRSLGGRFLMMAMLVLALPLLGAGMRNTLDAMLRLAVLLPWLALMQGLFALSFAIAQVLWHQTNYFLLPFGKIFLVLGGVWGPVADFSEPWRATLLWLPPSDLFFQPAYFCVKGSFYATTPALWLLRTGALAVVLSGANLRFFGMARRRHQSFGG
ncbi:MAG TPA: hypothetical protein VEY30_08785 [Myxococcaceae bacterium]|nr:hypothetical protein [Myxococcaceae bacterium]